MISEKQQKILAFPYTHFDALICDGAVRSGKTSLSMVSMVFYMMRNFSNRRFGVCGKTVDSATKNIIMPFMALSWARDRYKMKWRRSDKILEIRWKNNVNYFEVFGGKDESSFALIQGRTLAGLLLDEVVLMPRSFVEQALARCSVSGAKIWFCCNPGNPSHWFYTEWIQKRQERNALYLHFELRDNPSLGEDRLRYYESIYSGVFYDRYIRGLWIPSEGLVYPMFDEYKNIIHGNPDGAGEYYISIDYGTKNPTAMGLWRIHQGEAVMMKEYYYDSKVAGKQKTDEEYYQDLVAFAENEPIECIIIDPSAASFAECIRQHGRFYVRNADNSVLDGIRLTATLLQTGKLRFHASCTNTFREFRSYMWDADKDGEDAVIKENDHSLDQTRYLVYTMLWREVA